MSDPVNIRVMVPRVRRALVNAAGTVSVPSDLTDDAIKDATADSCAAIVLYTGNLFGKQLLVVATDADTGAPAEYATSAALGLDEQTLVAAQAALDHFFATMVTTHISERVADEASSYEWVRSASLLKDGLALLKSARDDALEALYRRDLPLDGYVSFLAVRDLHVAAMIEPTTVLGSGTAYGGYGSGVWGQEADYRFG